MLLVVPHYNIRVPHDYNIRVPHDVTADELHLEAGDAFNFEGALWRVESVVPGEDGEAVVTVDLEPWPGEETPPEIKSFP